jgi:hypothetical protein
VTNSLSLSLSQNHHGKKITRKKWETTNALPGRRSGYIVVAYLSEKAGKLSLQKVNER